MTLTHFMTYAIALAIAAAIPGPGVVALVARALGSGFRPTMPMLMGLVLGDVIYLAAAVLGLAYIATTFATVFIVLKYLGAAYLAYLAWSFWRSGISSENIKSKRAEGTLNAFAAGLFVTLGNPKTMIFYLALLPTFINLADVTLADFVLLMVLTFLVLVAVLVPYVAMAGSAREMLRTPRTLKLLNRFAATCLAGAAAAIALRNN